MIPTGLIYVIFGIFLLLSAILDWNWLMTWGREARWFVKILTRTGARIHYALVGIVMVVLGILFEMGIIKD